MASDDDEEELARLRAMRSSRNGGQPDMEQYFADKPAARHSHASQNDNDDDSDEAEDDAPTAADAFEEDAELLHEGMRAHLPMSFGRQEESAPKLQELHEQRKRVGLKMQLGNLHLPASAIAQHDNGQSMAQNNSSAAQSPPSATAQAQTGVNNVENGNNDDVVGPSLPAAADNADAMGPPRPPASSDDEDDEDGTAKFVLDGEAEYSDPYNLPVTHEVVLGGHNRVVSTLDVDHSGSRVVTGSFDYTVRMYDFNGIKADLRSFRDFEPFDGHPIKAVSWSPTGHAFLCVTGAAQAKFYDRDGRELGECVRGDMYIRDMSNTKGHVSALCAGQWHPHDAGTALTSSEDGTLRLWNVETLKQKTVIKPRLAKAQRVHVTACSYSSDGRLIAGGVNDGSLQLWNVGSKFGTSAAIGQVLPPKQQMVEQQNWKKKSGADQYVQRAHDSGCEISSVAFSSDGNTLLSRSLDETLKVWDVRKFKQPVHVFDGLPCMHATTQACFSPDGCLLITGTSADKQNAGGAVVFIDKSKMEVVRRVSMPGSVVALRWHARLNQLLVGVGDRSSGGTHVLYDPTFSERGAMLCVGRQPRAKNPFDFEAPLVIHNPHALAMYRDNPSRKRKKEKDLLDPVKAHRPDPGSLAGPGKGGRLGTTKGTLLTQHLMRQRGQLVGVDQEMDPREAILRHAGKQDEFSRFTAAYAKTQPKPIYAQDEEDDPTDEQQQ